MDSLFTGKSPIIGRYMEARRDIHPGEVVLSFVNSTPFCFSGDLHRPAGSYRARQQCPAHVHRLLEVKLQIRHIASHEIDVQEAERTLPLLKLWLATVRGTLSQHKKSSTGMHSFSGTFFEF